MSKSRLKTVNKKMNFNYLQQQRKRVGEYKFKMNHQHPILDLYQCYSIVNLNKDQKVRVLLLLGLIITAYGMQVCDATNFHDQTDKNLHKTVDKQYVNHHNSQNVLKNVTIFDNCSPHANVTSGSGLIQNNIHSTIKTICTDAGLFANNKPNIKYYKNIPIKTLSNNSIKKCTDKLEGGNAGKICMIEDKKYLMKVVNINDLHGDITTTDVLMAEYNFKLLQNMGLKVPSTQLVYEKNGFYKNRYGKIIPAEFYHASEFINHFQTFETFTQKIIAKLACLKSQTIYRNLSAKEILRAELVHQIGERGIAQLAVASSLIDDLITNQSNWGLAGEDLYIIDVDNAPLSLADYYLTATSMPLFFVIKGIPFSLKTVEEMIKIYRNMLDKPVPMLHADVNLSETTYQLLISSYLKSCEDTKAVIKSQFPDSQNGIASPIINTILEEMLTHELDQKLHPHKLKGR